MLSRRLFSAVVYALLRQGAVLLSAHYLSSIAIVPFLFLYQLSAMPSPRT
jgi:hypothetical protein